MEKPLNPKVSPLFQGNIGILLWKSNKFLRVKPEIFCYIRENYLILQIIWWLDYVFWKIRLFVIIKDDVRSRVFKNHLPLLLRGFHTKQNFLDPVIKNLVSSFLRRSLIFSAKISFSVDLQQSELKLSVFLVNFFCFRWLLVYFDFRGQL